MASCALLLMCMDAVLETAGAAEVKQPAFDIWEYRLEGNSLLATVTIEKALYPYLGPAKTIEDVQHAAENLEKIYRDSGYPAIFVDIPPQDVVNGVVVLKVTEGKIGRVTVSGARYFTPSGIRERLPALEEDRPLVAAEVQNDIRNLNGLTPDLKVAPILKPGKTPGQVDVELRVKDELPLHGDVEYNNFNSPDTTRGRARVSLEYDNLWRDANSFGLSYQESPQNPSQVQVTSASYGMPIGEGYRFSGYAVKSDTNVTTSVDASVGGNSLAVLGNGEIVGARIIHAILSSEGYSQALVFGADYKHFTEDVNGLNQGVRYFTFSAQYGGTVVGEKSFTSFTLNTTLGARGLLNREDEFEAKRADAHAGFMVLSGGVSRTDTLPADFQWISRLRWQLTEAPLIDNEQFNIGGYSSVRGYYESQALGDRGYSATLELRSPSFDKLFGKYINEARATVFYDWGQVFIIEAQPGQQAQINLQGIGTGLHVQAFDHLRTLWDFSYPLQDNGTIHKGDLRTNFQAIYDF